MTKTPKAQKTPPMTATPFKPYDPNRIPVVHRRSAIEQAPSMISGKLYPASKESAHRPSHRTVFIKERA